MRLLFVLLALVLSSNTSSVSFAAQPAVQQRQLNKPSPAVVEIYNDMVRLLSSIDLGLTFPQYNARVLDLKGTVDLKRAQLERTIGGSKLLSAMEAFIHAHNVWRIALSEEYVRVYLLRIMQGGYFAKYTPFVDGFRPDSYDQEWIQKVASRYPTQMNNGNTPTYERLVYPVLKKIWKQAVEFLDDAGEILER